MLGHVLGVGFLAPTGVGVPGCHRHLALSFSEPTVKVKGLSQNGIATLADRSRDMPCNSKAPAIEQETQTRTTPSKKFPLATHLSHASFEDAIAKAHARPPGRWRWHRPAAPETSRQLPEPRGPRRPERSPARLRT